MENPFELTAFQWTMNGLPADLLPPRSSFLITHDEVLVVNTCQVKVQYPPIDRRLPHQTGVTERSISGHDRRGADSVRHQVMVGHDPDWICDRLVSNGHSQNSIVIFDKRRIIRLHVSRIR